MKDEAKLFDLTVKLSMAMPTGIDLFEGYDKAQDLWNQIEDVIWTDETRAKYVTGTKMEG